MSLFSPLKNSSWSCFISHRPLSTPSRSSAQPGCGLLSWAGRAVNRATQGEALLVFGVEAGLPLIDFDDAIHGQVADDLGVLAKERPLDGDFLNRVS